MIGIEEIGVFIPPGREDNMSKAGRFDLSPEFIEEKIGAITLARKTPEQKASDLCLKAFEDLVRRKPGIRKKAIDFLCVVTQNGDFSLPQTSAILHGKLGLSEYCASFDIALGCSGYPYGLHTAKAFMEANGLRKGLLFTADPYSEIINSREKNTSLLFGDAAAVTLLGEDAIWDTGKGVFQTHGEKYETLINRGARLEMNGRAVFNFVMLHIPGAIERCIAQNDLTEKDIDLYALHQASKFIVGNLIKRMELDPEKVPLDITDLGNTISSSIPILLQGYLSDTSKKTILASGFGVGLSAATTILRRRGS